MLLFCPRGHSQADLPAMGGLCPVCIEEKPEEFECKDSECPKSRDGRHFHVDARSYFVDLEGNKY